MTKMMKKERQLCRRMRGIRTASLDYTVSHIFSVLVLLLFSSEKVNYVSFFFSATDVMVSRRTDRERIPVRYCSLGTRDAAKYFLFYTLIPSVWRAVCDRHLILCLQRSPHLSGAVCVLGHQQVPAVQCSRLQ